MRSWFALAAASLCLVLGVTSSPVEITEPAKELLPPKVDSGPTLATDLMPPPLPEESHKPERLGMLFLINVFAVKNETAEESNDVLQEDVLNEVPDDSKLEPLGMFLLVVEKDDENKPVSLDEVATDLTEEGFDIEKVSKDGETRLIKVNLDSVESIVKNAKVKADREAEEVKSKTKRAAEWESLESSGQLMKIRRKRHLCLKCMLGGGGGGGYYPPPQPIYQPVVVVPGYGGGGYGHHGGGHGGGFHRGGGGGNYYPQQQPYGQQGGYGYGPGGGGGNAYAHASASASAHASSNGYGGY